ncbi:hypothetical protein HZS_3697 [Henneguya salminicola]|nr:hypothetical protein HZS_3697 [Henneguya salminicola]
MNEEGIISENEFLGYQSAVNNEMENIKRRGEDRLKSKEEAPTDFSDLLKIKDRCEIYFKDECKNSILREVGRSLHDSVNHYVECSEDNCSRTQNIKCIVQRLKLKILKNMKEA